MVAEELRAIMASLGFRTVNEMVGHSEILKINESLRTPKTQHIDLSNMLKPAHEMRPGAATYRVRAQDHKLYIRLDNKFVDESTPALEQGLPVQIDTEVLNSAFLIASRLRYLCGLRERCRAGRYSWRGRLVRTRLSPVH